MTLTLPPKVTASTGIDALCHAIEGYTCLQKNPLSDAYAVAAMEMIVKNLPKAVAEPGNKQVRLAMANASLMAGTAFGNSMVGLVHAIGHSLGGICHVAHGDAMSILLPHVMAYNLDHCRDTYAQLLLHLAGPETYVKTPEAQRPEAAVALVREFVGQFHQAGLPLTLRDTGRVQEGDLEKVAKAAVNDGAIIVNPKAAAVADIVEILKKAW
jgi:alcohol dehydrogenase